MSRLAQALVATAVVEKAAKWNADEDAETAATIPLPLTQAALKATVSTSLLVESPANSHFYVLGT